MRQRPGDALFYFFIGYEVSPFGNPLRYPCFVQVCILKVDEYQNDLISPRPGLRQKIYFGWM